MCIQVLPDDEASVDYGLYTWPCADLLARPSLRAILACSCALRADMCGSSAIDGEGDVCWSWVRELAGVR